MKNSKAFSNLLGAVQKMQQGNQSYKDEFADKYWKLETDSAGNGYAVIRFLPAITDDDVPFVKLYNHGFKGDTGRWFIEQCPTTIGKPCPACEKNGELWSTGQEKDKETARARKRKTSYVANILVVSDSKNPDNEGKTFLWKFGKKIFDKIVDKIQPEFEDEAPVNVFDPLEGANFKLKQRKVEGWANFDKSEFDDVSEIGSAKEIDSIMKTITDLKELTAESSFKSYEDLKTKYAAATGIVAAKKMAPLTESDDDEEFVEKAVSKAKVASKAPVADDTEDDDLEYFKRLSEED
jgi:hypothetical protein